MNRIMRTALLVAIIASSGWLFTGEAGAVTIACGQSITTSIKVSNSLTDCNDAGLLVDADDITIDLNGKTLDGDHFDDVAAPETGIDLRGHSNVTIKNGTIRQFENGVFDDNAGGGNRIMTGLQIIDSTAVGISLAGENTIRKTTVRDGHARGIAVTGDDNLITATKVINNNDGGISATGNSNDIISNRITDNEAPGFLAITNFGLVITGNNNTAKGNAIQRNVGGLSATGTANTLTGNKLSGNTSSGIILTPTALVVAGADAVVQSNTLTANASGVGVSGTDHDIIGNLIRGRTPSGILILGSDGMQVTGTGHLISRNRLLKNFSTGIFVQPGSSNITLSRNVATGNAQDGILLAGTVLLQGNIANRNGFFPGGDPGDNFGLGINATDAIVDPLSAGNRAKGNDDNDQCEPEGLCN